MGSAGALTGNEGGSKALSATLGGGALAGDASWSSSDTSVDTSVDTLLESGAASETLVNRAREAAGNPPLAACPCEVKRAFFPPNLALERSPRFGTGALERADGNATRDDIALLFPCPVTERAKSPSAQARMSVRGGCRRTSERARGAEASDFRQMPFPLFMTRGLAA